jgi:hypothetical protein
MSAIPLHLQRRFEQRWAARFVSPVTSAAPKNVSLKGSVNSLARPAEAKEKPAGERGAGLAIIDQTAA